MISTQTIPFVFGLVGQHGATNDVADGIDTFDVGLEIRIDLHKAAVRDFDAELLSSPRPST